jgi:Fe-S-cluster-containing dehydrogenase component
MDKDTSKRRNFLRAGVALGLATVAGATELLGEATGGNAPAKSGTTVKLLSPDGEIVEVDAAELKMETHDHAGTMARNVTGREGIEGRKFVMVIDLGRCRNARKCITSCQKMHHIPEDKEWLQVKLMKDNDNAAPYWFPKTCFHCDNPPCVKVCPVDATFKRSDGLVLIDNERCIGCKFCMAGCPYSTRVFNWGEPEVVDIASCPPYSPETSTPSKHSTVEKCDFCPDMVREGKLPDCVTACPNGVFFFGDENEDTVTNGSETVRFTALLKEKSGYRFMEELGTKPRVYYLPPSSRMFPVERGFKNLTPELKERFKDVQ